MAAPLSTSASRGFLSTNPELAAADASVRWPVMISFLTAIHWLVTGTFLLVYASSLTHPHDSIPIFGLLIDLSYHCAFFTYGRVWPAAINALVYGWASTAGIGLIIWLMVRMGRTPLRLPVVLLTGLAFWNFGIAAGLIGIFLGNSTSVELLEFPAFATHILWISYVLMAISILATYLRRPAGNNHLGQAWLLVALLAFPWLLGAGSYLLGGTVPTGSGVMQDILDAWYVHGLYTLWLAPLGLGFLYYLIPKVSGLSIRFGGKARLAFWTWLVFAPWTAVHDLVGGPVPAETVTVGLILSGLIFIPVALIGLNLVPTALAGEEKHHGGIVLPFLTLAAVMFVAAGISEQVLSIRTANEVLRFTLFRETNFFLWVYGFFSFGAFGAIYYIVPRLLNFGWRSGLLVRAHYYASLYGILLVTAIVSFGGVMEGFTLENLDPNVTIVTANDVSISFFIATTMCLSIISIGNGIFAWHLGWMVVDWLRLRIRANATAAEILNEPYEAPALPASESEVAA